MVMSPKGVRKAKPAPEIVKRIPSVPEMLAAGGKSECGRDAAAVGKVTSVKKAVEAASKQKERTPTPYTEGGGGNNLRFKTKSGAG